MPGDTGKPSSAAYSELDHYIDSNTDDVSLLGLAKKINSTNTGVRVRRNDDGSAVVSPSRDVDSPYTTHGALGDNSDASETLDDVRKSFANMSTGMEASARESKSDKGREGDRHRERVYVGERTDNENQRNRGRDKGADKERGQDGSRKQTRKSEKSDRNFLSQLDSFAEARLVQRAVFDLQVSK